MSDEALIQSGGGYESRVRICLESFRERHGQWPSRLHLSRGAHRLLLDVHLTPLGYSALSSRVHLIVSPYEDGPLIAEDERGRSFNYGAEEHLHGSNDALEWLTRCKVGE